MISFDLKNFSSCLSKETLFYVRRRVDECSVSKIKIFRSKYEQEDFALVIFFGGVVGGGGGDKKTGTTFSPKVKF